MAAVAVLLGLTVLAVWLTSGNPGSLDDRDNQIDFTRHLAWLLVVLPALALVGRYRMRAALRDALLWMGAAGVLVVGYSYRAELTAVADRVTGEIAPRRGVTTEGGAVTFRAARDGHFHVDAAVDGATIRFMVDTGASDVVLSAADAKRLGLDLKRLSFIRTYRTANGPVSGAPVTLREIRIGPITLSNVHASVNGGELDHSLLGMSFLGRLAAYGVENGTLTLRQ